jgi:hypothetical protein
MSNEAQQTLQTTIQEAHELAEFETPYVQVQAMPVQWSIEKIKVAQLLALTGKTKTAVAKEMKLPLTVINKWLENGEFNEYIRNLVTEGASILKAKRLQLLTKILDARIEEAEREGYSCVTKKDTVDIVSELRKETGEDKHIDNSYTSLLEKLVLSSTQHNNVQPKIINVEDL